MTLSEVSQLAARVEEIALNVDDKKAASMLTSMEGGKGAMMKEAAVFDISGSEGKVMDRAEEVFAALENGIYAGICLSNWRISKEAAKVAADALRRTKDTLKADLSAIVAGLPEAEALAVMVILSNALEGAMLKSLNLSENALGEKGVRAFQSLLKTQEHLEELKFVQNGISPDAATAIVELIPSGNELKVLHFHNNDSNCKGAQTLARVVSEASHLEDFRFSSSRVGREGGIALADALRAGCSLKKLDLSDNMFGCDAGLVLASALKQHTQLQELYLADMQLHNKGVQALVEALVNVAPNLTVLDLGHNYVTESLALELAGWIAKLHNLKKLSLAENKIKDKGVVAISVALEEEHDNLEELDLTATGCSSKGAVAAAKAVANKRWFKNLVLKKNQEGLAEVERILEAGVGASVLHEKDEEDESDDEEESL